MNKNTQQARKDQALEQAEALNQAFREICTDVVAVITSVSIMVLGFYHVRELADLISHLPL